MAVWSWRPHKTDLAVTRTREVMDELLAVVEEIRSEIHQEGDRKKRGDVQRKR